MADAMSAQKSRKQKDKPQAITANRLIDGEVIYFTEAREWSERFEDAAVMDSPEALGEMMTAAQDYVAACFLVEPYPFPVIRQADGSVVPESVREKIRAKGPTVHLDQGKQAGQGTGPDQGSRAVKTAKAAGNKGQAEGAPRARAVGA